LAEKGALWEDYPCFSCVCCSLGPKASLYRLLSGHGDAPLFRKAAGTKFKVEAPDPIKFTKKGDVTYGWYGKTEVE
jgi:hypothetical protein